MSDSVLTAIVEKDCWWTISGPALVNLLRRAHAGENPDQIYAREYLAADSEEHE